jgi:hypothetical protein
MHHQYINGDQTQRNLALDERGGGLQLAFLALGVAGANTTTNDHAILGPHLNSRSPHPPWVFRV